MIFNKNVLQKSTLLTFAESVHQNCISELYFSLTADYISQQLLFKSFRSAGFDELLILLSLCSEFELLFWFFVA